MFLFSDPTALFTDILPILVQRTTNWGTFASSARQLHIWFYTLLVNKPLISRAMNWFFTENLQICRKVNFLNSICHFGLIWPAFSKKCKKYGGGIAIAKNKNVKSGLTTWSCINFLHLGKKDFVTCKKLHAHSTGDVTWKFWVGFPGGLVHRGYTNPERALWKRNGLNEI